jgi:hypothetical protein
MKNLLILFIAFSLICCNESNKEISRTELFQIVNAIRKDNPGYFSSNYCSKFIKPDLQYIDTVIFEAGDIDFLGKEISNWDTIVIRAEDLKITSWEKLASMNCYGMTFPLISSDRRCVVLCSEAFGVERYNICYRFRNGKWEPHDLGTTIY